MRPESEEITDRQRLNLLRLARGLNLDGDALRAMTPRGKISLLTGEKAEQLIARLRELYPPTTDGACDRGSVTAGQAAILEAFRRRLGDDGILEAWLVKRFGLASVDAIRDGATAAEIIGELARMATRHWGRTLATWRPGVTRSGS